MNNILASLALEDLPLSHHVTKVFVLYGWEAVYFLFTFKKTQYQQTGRSDESNLAVLP